MKNEKTKELSLRNMTKARLIDEVTMLRTQVRTANKKVNYRDQKIEKMDDEIAELQDHVVELRQPVEEKLSNLKEHLRKAHREEVNALRLELKEESTKLSAAGDELDVIRNAAERVRLELRGANVQLKKAGERIEELEGECTRLRKEAVGKMRMREEAERLQLSAMERRHRKKMSNEVKSREEAEEHCGRLSTTLVTHSAKYSAMEHEHKREKIEADLAIESAAELITNLQEEVKRLSELFVDEQTSADENLQKMLDQSRRRVRSLKGALSNAHTGLRSKDEQLNDAADKISLLSKRAEAMGKQDSKNLKDLAEQEAIIERQDTQNKDLARGVLMVMKTIKTLELHNEQLKKGLFVKEDEDSFSVTVFGQDAKDVLARACAGDDDEAERAQRARQRAQRAQQIRDRQVTQAVMCDHEWNYDPRGPVHCRKCKIVEGMNVRPSDEFVFAGPYEEADLVKQVMDAEEIIKDAANALEFLADSFEIAGSRSVGESGFGELANKIWAQVNEAMVSQYRRTGETDQFNQRVLDAVKVTIDDLKGESVTSHAFNRGLIGAARSRLHNAIKSTLVSE